MEWNLDYNVDKFHIDFNTGKITYINLDTNKDVVVIIGGSQKFISLYKLNPKLELINI